MVGQVNAQNPPSTCAHILQTIGKTVSDWDGIKKISELFTSIVSLLSYTLSNVPQPLLKLSEHFNGILNINLVINIIRRIKEFSHDEDGLWDSPWSWITSCVTFAGANAINFVYYLGDTLKCFDLGKALVPMGHVSNMLMVASCASEIWYDVSRGIKGCRKIKKASERAEMWKKWSENYSKEGVEAHYKLIWHQRVAASTDETRKFRMQAQWQAVAKCQDQVALKTFCERKITYWRDVAHNQNKENTRSWVNTAKNVLFIAWYILAIVLPAPTAIATLIGIAALTLVSSIFDLTTYLMGVGWAPEKVEPVPLPY